MRLTRKRGPRSTVWYQPQGRCTRAGVRASATPLVSSSPTSALDLLRPVDRRDEHRVGGVDDGDPFEPEHAEQPAVRAQVAVAHVAGEDLALAHHAGLVARALLPDRLPVADVRPVEAGLDHQRPVGVLHHRVVEADLRRLGEGRPEPQRPHVVDRLVERRGGPRRAPPAPAARSRAGPHRRGSRTCRRSTGSRGRAARRRASASGFSTKRATSKALALRRAALDVAVGGGRPGRRARRRRRCRRRPPASPPAPPPRRRRRASGIRWSDGSTSSVARRVAALGDAGGGDDRRQRVARLRLEHRLDPRAGLARLVGDQEARRRGADHDRVGEGAGGEPRDRALERRDAAHDRRVLLGEVAPRHRPQPRPRPAAEHRRDDAAGPRGSALTDRRTARSSDRSLRC